LTPSFGVASVEEEEEEEGASDASDADEDVAEVGDSSSTGAGERADTVAAEAGADADDADEEGEGTAMGCLASAANRIADAIDTGAESPTAFTGGGGGPGLEVEADADGAKQPDEYSSHSDGVSTANFTFSRRAFTRAYSPQSRSYSPAARLSNSAGPIALSDSTAARHCCKFDLAAVRWLRRADIVWFTCSHSASRCPRPILTRLNALLAAAMMPTSLVGGCICRRWRGREGVR
jgi:hypothetical protein